MKWLKEQGCPWNDHTFAAAVQNGDLDNLKWLKEQGSPWGDALFRAAKAYKDDSSVKFTFDHSFDWEHCEAADWLKRQGWM